MIIDKINIEGIISKENLKNFSLNSGKIFNEVVSIKLEDTTLLKEIIEINLDSTILNRKNLKFKDGTISTISVSTTYKVLGIENDDLNKLLFINYETISTLIITGEFLEEKKLSVDLIDCYFKLKNNYTISGSLTFFINIIDKIPLEIDEIDIKKLQYKFIDVIREVY